MKMKQPQTGISAVAMSAVVTAIAESSDTASLTINLLLNTSLPVTGRLLSTAMLSLSSENAKLAPMLDIGEVNIVIQTTIPAAK